MITDHVEQVTLLRGIIRSAHFRLLFGNCTCENHALLKISAYVKHDLTNRSNIVLELDLCIENFYEIIFLFSSLK